MSRDRDPDPQRRRSPSARQRARLRRRRLLGRWLAAAVLLGVAVACIQPVKSFQAAVSEVTRKQAEVETLERKREKLTKKLALAETDAFIEREARTHGLVRPGETLFLIQGIEKWQRAEEQRNEDD
jgi:cell division protein FtsB